MADRNHKPQPQAVRSMFSRIAKRYDRLNRIMTFGQDRSWRQQAVKLLQLKPADRILDIGTGTGDLAYEVFRQQPAAMVAAADFTSAMIQIGRARTDGAQPAWIIADTTQLPFAAGTFNGIISGFLLRNVADLPQALIEQIRVLKAGGRWVALETTPPSTNLLQPLIQFYLRRIIPALGHWLAGDSEAYRYLPSSTEGFLAPTSMQQALQQAGLTEVHYQRMMLGTVALYWGRAAS